MPRFLRKLVIDSVDSVDRAANEGAKVLIRKRQDLAGEVSLAVACLAESTASIIGDTSLSKKATSAALATTFQQFDDFMKTEVVPDSAVDNDDVAPATTNHPISQLADLVAEAGGVDRATALSWLLHTPKGQSLVLRINKNDDTKSRETPTMNRADELKAIAKQHGVVALAKMLVSDGNSHGISEFEFTGLVTDFAKANKLPGETESASFERTLTHNTDIWKALAVVKAAPVNVQPTQVGGNDALDTDTDQSAAMLELEAMAEKLRASSPYLSVAQAFSTVFTAPENSALAARAHVRPAPTTSYAFPR